jgi:hypothetical protein
MLLPLQIKHELSILTSFKTAALKFGIELKSETQ